MIDNKCHLVPLFVIKDRQHSSGLTLYKLISYEYSIDPKDEKFGASKCDVDKIHQSTGEDGKIALLCMQCACE